MLRLSTISEARPGTEVLLVHAPYPGRLMFEGHPTSMLSAIAPFAARSGTSAVGYLDPGTPSEAFYSRLRELSRTARVVCISTSTAAIEEASRVALEARAGGGEELLVLGGGPHEDDCAEKMAERIPEVDLSIAGDAEHLLADVLDAFLGTEATPSEFCTALVPPLISHALGRGVASSCWWDGPVSVHFNGEPGPAHPRPIIEKPVRFTVFNATRVLPVMVSRGCPYGRCTFCAEGGSGQVVEEDFGWIESLMNAHPGAPLYFQDSIFPRTQSVEKRLLPLLREARVPWGCQVYLGMLSERFVRQLADHGCRYLYTGVESGGARILAAIGKPGLARDVVLQRIHWIRAAGMKIGISLMFGALSPEGALLETPATVIETMDLVSAIYATGVEVAGVYPNVETVLPGTGLAQTLAGAGVHPDFYRMPRFSRFAVLEDGGVGYNFATLRCQTLTTRIVVDAIIMATTG
jgi:radical SAM superfamily enzyme YgiQ (UPF0313 family)